MPKSLKKDALNSHRHTVDWLVSVLDIKRIRIVSPHDSFSHLLIDSRQVFLAHRTLFFAIRGAQLDGHNYIVELYQKGVRHFVVNCMPDLDMYPEANFIEVDDTVYALQQLATYNRNVYNYPVCGVTGSNGKTIVKEWLYQLLSIDTKVVKNPKSYNSQVGVPLSVWNMDENYSFAVFEAGISQPLEMKRLQLIINPTLGIFTNIGEAHSKGFTSRKQKIREKLSLFDASKTLIYCLDQKEVHESIEQWHSSHKNTRLFTWSIYNDAADVYMQIKAKQFDKSITPIFVRTMNQCVEINIPFVDRASIENVMHCIATLAYLKKDLTLYLPYFSHLTSLEMRLELKKGMDGSMIINDSYSADISSIKMALDFLKAQNTYQDKWVILSDIMQSSKSNEVLYTEAVQLIEECGVQQVIGIGENIIVHKHIFDTSTTFSFASYPNVSYFLRDISTYDWSKKAVLVKGARIFEFERITAFLEQKAHQTVLEVDLSALIHNLRIYQKKLQPKTKVMAMVKAFGYGSGAYEVADALEYAQVDYLAVAYTDEGIALRKSGISLPIMVMNPEVNSFEKIIQYDLEPEIYSIKLLHEFIYCLTHLPSDKSKYPIHLKLDTGMNRLGFSFTDLPSLLKVLKDTSLVSVRSVFSHLSASESSTHDAFTIKQISLFDNMALQIEQVLGYSFLRHILNSAGIIRHLRAAEYDMVRIGIGLYGIDYTGILQKSLESVMTLKAVISQIKILSAGDSVGYGREMVLSRSKKIATLSIGYADGIRRTLGNGSYAFLVKGQKAPTIGHICMDMCMIDVTSMEVEEGDEVIIFGSGLSIMELAQHYNTIVYEVFTGLSERIKRVYYRA